MDERIIMRKANQLAHLIRGSPRTSGELLRLAIHLRVDAQFFTVFLAQSGREYADSLLALQNGNNAENENVENENAENENADNENAENDDDENGDLP